MSLQTQSYLDVEEVVMDKAKIKELVSQLTLEEKAGLTSGADVWHAKAIERLGIPATCTSDGPHGLRKQAGNDGGLTEANSAKATCYPAGCATAASFDRDLLYTMGQTLGRESQALDVNVLLGPGVNMKRSPLCGRNFEYFSEDPLLAGEIGAAYVNGVQSEGVGTSLKHFFANSQEHRRMDSSSEMDERTMREIYLPAFETVVKKAQPWTIMASYNKVNGTHSTENKEAIENILRKEWGYEGLVVSDWGATHNRPGAVAAGCDLTMPAENTDAEIVKAVQEGTLSEAELDACCERVIELAFKSAENHKEGVVFDYEGDHELARKIAEESMVLLKNDGLLPLNKNDKVAFIGAFASAPRFQGGGSSHINSYKIVSALDAVKASGISVSYAAGYEEKGTTTDELLAEAVAVAKDAEKVVLFIGLPDSMESEGVDRMHMGLPEGHNKLVDEICAANPNVAVVLHNGSPVEMPWVERPQAILEAYLGGQAVGEATVNILYGNVNPSGHLPETFPKKLSDNPSYLFYFGEGSQVHYQEGIFIGYRYYETKEMDVLFPFGHGLSYTSFRYSDLTLDKAELEEGDTLQVSVKVTNTGSRAGKAVVQLYVAPAKAEIIRPVRELKEFAKVALEAGETKEVTFTLDKRAFAHWNTVLHAWKCECGKYTIQIGENAHDICLSGDVHLQADPIPPVGGYCMSVPMSMIEKTRKGRKFLDENIIYMVKGMMAAGFIPQEMQAVIDSVPGGLTLDVINMIAARAGAAGATAGGMSGLSLLLSQSLSIFAAFLPAEKKKELAQLIDELNQI